MSSIVEQGYGVGDVISLLWFKRSLPRYCTRFIEICVMLCADHGHCVSGAHNTIVTARAGKDLVSSLVSGLLTIGPRFGGAIDDAAARYFKDAYEKVLVALTSFEGHSKATMLLIFNNAAQGILSSFFFKYADTILKKYLSTFATIFTGIAFATLFGHSDYKLYVRNYSCFHLNTPVLFSSFKGQR
ncbi:ATP-citrate synthase beta chain protein 1 [Camellia lanceoleosa]|uniref:ATP-citrate synthase beta chain protein 1 n=1 Tax=Camellia lanceoleosa TaxID=1840588 RepID=A0ACC0HMM1_9ERIC|nr:ATP-citrate synthase beta chain protein 1 [Camellia lanceoleosa]